MSLQVIDLARKAVVTDLLKTKTVLACWPRWQPKLRHLLGPTPKAQDVLNIGNHLSEIFQSTTQAGRGQSTVSGGGAAWEALICYYLNLCLIGTNTVVFKKRSSVPKPVQHALTISYRNVPANTESDLVAITFPQNELALETPLGSEKLLARLNGVAEERFRDLSVTVIQCKTNWNDNAQIPMMWDMIYNVKEFKDPRITRGSSSFHIENLTSFNYALATVPTNKLSLFKPNSLSVRRVSELSGGNYWGRATSAGIAKSIREIFGTAKIGPNQGRGLIDSLSISVPELASAYDHFRLDS